MSFKLIAVHNTDPINTPNKEYEAPNSMTREAAIQLAKHANNLISMYGSRYTVHAYDTVNKQFIY